MNSVKIIRPRFVEAGLRPAPTRGERAKSPERQERIKAAAKEPRTVLRTDFVNASKNPNIAGADQLASKVNYLKGNNPANWQTDLPTFGSITYQQLYPGIDLRYDSANGSLKSTYVVAPNGDPSAIRWRYKGAKDVSVDGSGNLIIQLAPPPGRNKEDRSLTEQAPVAWQEINGQRVAISVQYAVEPNGSV